MNEQVLRNGVVCFDYKANYYMGSYKPAVVVTEKGRPSFTTFIRGPVNVKCDMPLRGKEHSELVTVYEVNRTWRSFEVRKDALTKGRLVNY